MSRKSEFKIPPISPLVGSSLSIMRQVLKGNKVDPKYRLKVRITYVLVTVTTAFRILDHLYFRRKLKKYRFSEPPLFIIGHWRSGTTLLHNLLTRDRLVAYATTYQCVFPDNLKSKWLFKTFMRIFMPRVRPGDNLELKASFPQEDEYAISNLTHRSYYHFFYFPSAYRTLYKKYIRFETLTEKEIGDWKKLYRQMVIKAMLNKGGSRIVLKNPVNTGRMPRLLEIFPEANFIHIIRNPVIVYLSTFKFFSQLFPTLNLELFSDEEISEMVLEVYGNMMRNYLEDRKQVHPDRLLEIRYEELVENPVHNIGLIYRRFSFPEFENVKSAISDYLDTLAGHKIDSYTMSQAELDRVMHHVGFAMEQWNYRLPDNMEVIS